MRRTDFDIRHRCAEELQRVFPSDAALARQCGFGLQQAQNWLSCYQVPSAVSLRVLDQHGVDIYYIITGKRNPAVGGDR